MYGFLTHKIYVLYSLILQTGQIVADLRKVIVKFPLLKNERKRGRGEMCECTVTVLYIHTPRIAFSSIPGLNLN